MTKKSSKPLKITTEQLRKIRKAVDIALGLQKNTVGTGPHKTYKDNPRKNTVKQWDT